MAKVYDVPADLLIGQLTETLKSEGISMPSWIPFVKTGSHAVRQPHNREWWYVRCASIMRKIYLHGPIGIGGLRREYGGGKPVGYGAAHHRDAGGAIIRNAVHALEKMGYVEKARTRGRVVSKQGMKKLDNMSTEIFKGMVQKTPELDIYTVV